MESRVNECTRNHANQSVPIVAVLRLCLPLRLVPEAIRQGPEMRLCQVEGTRFEKAVADPVAIVGEQLC